MVYDLYIVLKPTAPEILNPGVIIPKSPINLADNCADRLFVE